MKDIRIHTEYITLGQALKLSGEVSSGIDAKIVIQEGDVLVNGEVDTRRGKKLRDGDVFEYNHHQYMIRDH
ncbi:MAG: RNA-binding S4 domain-containing protein [Erysipelotrichaceae bacterium]|nr:RNA-binding S4 domain-containing protein [Erysipelotrichaceae bacterium]